MKNRVFQVDPSIAEMHPSSRSRALLRRALAGRTIIANNKTQAVEELYVRFGRFAVYEMHLRQLEYPCSPESFDDFLMLSGGQSGADSVSLSDDVVESLLDLRGREASSILGHGLYSEAIQRYNSVYPSSQMLILLTEELQNDVLGSLEQVQAFLGIPLFDYRPFAVNGSRGNLIASFQRSKTVASRYLPMSAQARNALEGYYAGPNRQLAAFLDDGRLQKFWNVKQA
jgi:hypothetical protein